MGGGWGLRDEGRKEGKEEGREEGRVQEGGGDMGNRL
jgi:hypothetical protein